MGSASSRPQYPFPVPASPHSAPLRTPKSGRWPSLSTRKRGKKGKDREKLDPFILPKYPTSTTAMYGFPYYQAPIPTYYAPVQMAVLQPMGVQQPMLAMPQSYLPIATAAPVQPAVAPIIQPPGMQMPVPIPAPAHASVPMPVPAPVPMPAPAPGPIHPTPLSSAPPTQMPEPYPVHEPHTQRPAIPPTPVIADPVIPPPPIVNFELRTMPDSARPRFTGFYRPPDLPPPPVDANEPMPEPEPASLRPPIGGGMPHRSTMPPLSSTPMPMPMPASSSRNPLPPPPADVWNTSPYREVAANLRHDISSLLDVPATADMLVTEPAPQPSSRLGTLFGSSSHRDKGKGPLRGLFRSFSTSAHGNAGPSSGSRHGHGHSRAQTMTSIVVPPPVSAMPFPDQAAPIRFDHTGEYAGFVNHSHHRVMYKNKMYPTALHLLEAMKFIHRPDLQERIRTCKDVHDMYPLSASFQEHVRSDWGQVFLKIMEDVLYLKFKQHPPLRTLLLQTGLVDIIYSDENEFWGEGPMGEGANELGRALVCVRERLRQDGEW